MSASSTTPSGPWAAARGSLPAAPARGGNGGFEDMFGGLFTGDARRHAGGFNTVRRHSAGVR